jgi:hypothetical protein
MKLFMFIMCVFALVYIGVSAFVLITLTDRLDVIQEHVEVTLPQTDDVVPLVQYPAGSDVPEWRLILSYEVQDYMDACKLERKLRGMME